MQGRVRVKRGLCVDVVVRQGARVHQLPPLEYQPLVVERDARLFRSIGFHGLNGVTEAHVQSDGEVSWRSLRGCSDWLVPFAPSSSASASRSPAGGFSFLERGQREDEEGDGDGDDGKQAIHVPERLTPGACGIGGRASRARGRSPATAPATSAGAARASPAGTSRRLGADGGPRPG